MLALVAAAAVASACSKAEYAAKFGEVYTLHASGAHAKPVSCCHTARPPPAARR